MFSILSNMALKLHDNKMNNHKCKFRDAIFIWITLCSEKNFQQVGKLRKVNVTDEPDGEALKNLIYYLLNLIVNTYLWLAFAESESYRLYFHLF